MSTSWLKEALVELLGFEDVDEICTYLRAMSDVAHVEEYVLGLSGDAAKAKDMAHKLAMERQSSTGTHQSHAARTTTSQAMPTGKNFVLYEKEKEERAGKRQEETQNQNEYAVNQHRGSRVIIKKKKEKMKQWSQEERGGLASRSNQIINCIECGKIELKGALKCSFCAKELMYHGDASKEAMDDSSAEAAGKAAIEHKNKLLDFDRTSAARSVVIDDQADYYHDAQSVWLGEEEKEMAQKKEEARMEANKKSNQKVKVSFDFAGRRVLVMDEADVSESTIFDEVNDHRISPRIESSGLPAAAAAAAVDFGLGSVDARKMGKSDHLQQQATEVYDKITQLIQARRKEHSSKSHKKKLSQGALSTKSTVASLKSFSLQRVQHT